MIMIELSFYIPKGMDTMQKQSQICRKCKAFPLNHTWQ